MSSCTWAVMVVGPVLVGCLSEGAPPNSGGGPGSSEPKLEVRVAPLELPGVVDACYSLEVLNEAGQTVWTKAGVCASRYGDGASSVTWVGPCDASDLDLDGTAEATLVVRVEALFAEDDTVAPDGDDAPDRLADWKDPCAAPYAPAGCRVAATCREGADTLVALDLTIMRSARQGFFDVAVSFEDIFCSAKVDCAYPASGDTPARPIELVFDPLTDERVQTVVWAFACTAGEAGAGEPTYLYMDDLTLRCGGQTYTIAPSEGPGAIYPSGAGAPAPLVQAMIFEGREAGGGGPAGADVLYWNAALGLSPRYFVAGAPTCVLETRATAAQGVLVDGETPARTSYPFVSVSVPLNRGATITCTQHPLDGEGVHAGVSTTYTGAAADGAGFATTRFAHVGTPTVDALVTSTAALPIDECETTDCGPHARCVDLPVGFDCRCLEGFERAGGACVDVDECAEGLAACAAPNPFCRNLEGGFTCHGTELVAWGTGQADVAPLVGAVAVAAGGNHSLALRGDGAIVGFGLDLEGQLDAPAGLGSITALAAGGSHSVALDREGSVTAWGANDQGQLEVPSDLGPVAQVAAGGAHTLALRRDGAIVGWGSGARGQLDLPAELEGAAVVAVAAGMWHSVALKADGTVIGWGDDGHGQSSPPSGLGGVVAIAAGGHHTVALKADGTVVAWGDNSRWQALAPAWLNGVVAIAAGREHSLALRGDGTVVAWGYDGSGQVSVPDGLADVVAIAAGADHSLALRRDGVVIAWGFDGSGQASPPRGMLNPVEVAAGEFHALARDADGGLWTWGLDSHGQATTPALADAPVALAAGGYHSLVVGRDGGVLAFGRGDEGQVAVPGGLRDAHAVAAGRSHSVALLGDGSLVSWGRNTEGQVATPLGLGRVRAVAAGGLFTVALEEDGGVVAWGANDAGQCAVPAGLGEVVAVAAGLGHTLAVKADGQVVAWGLDGNGQADVPSGLAGVVAVAAGRSHSLALRADGSVVAWGSDYLGQASVPWGLGEVVAIAAGGDQSYAIRRVSYRPAPTLAGLDRLTGAPGEVLVVDGADLERVIAVRVANNITRWEVVSPTQLRVTLPEVDAVGPVEVVTVTGAATSADNVTVGQTTPVE